MELPAPVRIPRPDQLPLDRRPVELHFHLLPGVDDGPDTMEESVELARRAVADGTSTVIATPHVRAVELDELPGRIRALGEALTDAGVALEVRCGGELAYDDVATVTDAQLDSIAHGPAHARWVLLEAPLPATHADSDDFRAAAEQLRARGFAVLIAHPERSDALFSDGGVALHDELAAGSLLQLNATSLTGDHGERERTRALQLAHAGLAAVVASDAHGGARSPALTPARQALIESGLDTRAASDMTVAAPRAVLDHGLDAWPGPHFAASVRHGA